MSILIQGMTARRRLHALGLALTLVLAFGCASNGGETKSDAKSDAASGAAQSSSSSKAGDTTATKDASGSAAADSAAKSAPKAAQQKPVPPSPGPPSVALARFTTAIENREPVDAVSFLSNDQTEIFFYTDLRNLNQKTVVHRWEYNGDVQAEVRFPVQSDRWRVWSSKKLVPEWLGDWQVSVVTESGEVLATETFTYQVRP